MRVKKIGGKTFGIKKILEEIFRVIKMSIKL